MTTHLMQRFLLVMLFAAAPHASIAATATSQTASIGIKSTRDKGVVSIMTDPVLADGRLVLKVVALNPTAQPQQLSAAGVQVFTAAGKPVPLMTLDELIAEAQGETVSPTAEHQSSNYSRPQVTTSVTGEPDVTELQARATRRVERSQRARPCVARHRATIRRFNSRSRRSKRESCRP